MTRTWVKLLWKLSIPIKFHNLERILNNLAAV